MKNLLKSFLLLSLILVLNSCGREDGPRLSVSNDSPGLGLQSAPNGLVSYDQVKYIFKNVCANCHKPGGNQPDWTDEKAAIEYAKTKGQKLKMKVVARQGGEMPMAPFQDKVTDEERQLIGKWVDSENGLVESISPAPNSSTVDTSPGIGLPPHLNFVQTCYGCHGNNGLSQTPGIPNLAGLSPQYLQSTINDFIQKRRSDSMMTPQALQLSPLQLEDLMLFIPNLKIEPVKSIENIDLYNKGQQISKMFACTSCHVGADLKPIDGSIPNILYQDKKYLENQFNAFVNGDRESTMMAGTIDMMKNTEGFDITDPENAKALAEYFGSYKDNEN
ncbi:MAG: c-type cytochrome [Bdellovibrionales bacterium]|nr:c-type cytochrome [Bdellovibrionales bacterium]